MSNEDLRNEALTSLVHRATARAPLGLDREGETWTRALSDEREAIYTNRNPRLGIDFRVERLAFPDGQTMDPRIVRIAPGANNERHKHAHESLFVVLDGEGEVTIGERSSAIGPGDVAFVPRWIMHQTRNTSSERALVLLAITDFGFTSAVLGDYDRRTRLRHAGDDASE